MRFSAPALTRRRLLIGAALLVILGAGVVYAHWSVVEHRFRVVSVGRLYQSAAMPPAALADAVREHEIRTVIDLRLESEGELAAERRALSALGVRYVHVPSGHAPRLDTVDKFLAVVGRTENLPVLVHCGHGEGRSVLFAALYRIEFEDWDNERARRACRLFPWRGTFRPDGPKGSYLLAYRRRLGQPSR